VSDVSAPSYFTDRSHWLIAGVTGARTRFGGKTALATWFCDTHGRASNDVVLFLNSKGDNGPERYADVVVDNVPDVAPAVQAGNEWVTITPESHDWAAVSRRLAKAVRSMPDHLDKLVVCDEAPELDSDSLQFLVRVAGNGHNCKTLLIAQAPGDLSTGVRRQCLLCWVGPATENNRHVFRANNRENHFQKIVTEHDPYQWSVLLGPEEEDRDTFGKVPEEYADD